MLPPPPSPPLNSLIMHDLNPDMWKKELLYLLHEVWGFARILQDCGRCTWLCTSFVFPTKAQLKRMVRMVGTWFKIHGEWVSCQQWLVPWMWPSGDDQIMCSLHPVEPDMFTVIVRNYLSRSGYYRKTCLCLKTFTSVSFGQNQQLNSLFCPVRRPLLFP